MIRIILWILLALAGTAAAGAAGIWIGTAIITARRPLRKLYRERTTEEDFIPLDKVPAKFLHFIVEVEDQLFYEHHGFWKPAIQDALEINWKAKKFLVGASTLTQQLVKNLYFHFYHNPVRKTAEAIITRTAERKLGKRKILEMYVNVVYFGNGIYGLTHAARFYFGKRPEEMTTNQLFLTACIVNAPTRGNPIQYPEVFERLRNKRLNLLVRRGTISAEDEAVIRGHHADCLDEELRKNDAFTQRYPQEIPMVNNRFGPWPDPEKYTLASIPHKTGEREK